MSTESISVVWLRIGTGDRSHAFHPSDARYAYCNAGPGDPDAVAPATHCRTCERRLERIAVQEAELDRLLSD